MSYLKIVIIGFFFLSLNVLSYADDNKSSQLYLFRVISFHEVLDLYCSQIKCGYYRYEVEIENEKFYMTYEGRDFYKQSLFNENFTILMPPLSTTLWTFHDGTTTRLKRAYKPVIDNDKKKTRTEYGYDRDAD